MDNETFSSCPWLERVSAFLDGELPFAEQEMVATHAQSCTVCNSVLNQSDVFNGPSRLMGVAQPRPFLEFPQRNTPLLRAILAIIGTVIIMGSVPGFIRGSTNGNSVHDLRHLSIWQVAIGAGVISASISFRISRLLTVIIAAFLLLTTIATVYDLLTGHRGPWTDPLHLVEIAGVLAIMRLIYPHLHLARVRCRELLQNR